MSSQIANGMVLKMAEYIDREALLLRIDCHGTNKFGMLDEDIRVFVKEQPAADVAPVVHGRWNNMDGYKTRKVCSECGWDVPEYGKFYSYCPNCGAKMDGGAENAVD